MSEPRDPFEILRRLNPIEPEDVRGAASAEPAAERLQRILADHPRHARTWRAQIHPARPRAQIHPARPRPRLIYLIGLASLVAILAAAAWALTRGAPTALTVGCYATADLQAHTVVIPAGDRTPIASCRAVWERGEFGTRTAAPRLQACALPSSAVAVFPSPHNTACKTLRLRPLPAARSGEAATASLVRVRAALVPKFLAKPCMNEEQATATVHAAMREAHLNGWTVKEQQPFDATRPCASLAFDEQQHVVLLVPLPRGG
jgi:ferric-dicitrate binding protein FerR (iron transport regulator)